MTVYLVAQWTRDEAWSLDVMPKKFKVKVSMQDFLAQCWETDIHLQEYKEPREKYIVIVEPWGRFGPNSLEDVNRIYWWLVDMLSDTHPNDHPNVIYYQDTVRVAGRLFDLL